MVQQNTSQYAYPNPVNVGSAVPGPAKGKTVPTNPIAALKDYAAADPSLAQFFQSIAAMDPAQAKKAEAAAEAAGTGTSKGATTTGPPSDPKTSTTDDALTMGLGMFFQQYLGPLMAQQSQANNAQIGQYGQAMNQALQNPLPPGVKGILSAGLPQQQGLMAMMNQAAMQQSAGTIPFQQFIQGVGGETSALQTAGAAATRAATDYELNLGQGQVVANALQPFMPTSQAAGIFTSPIASGQLSPVPGVTDSGTTTTPAGNAAASGATPAATPSASAGSAIQQAIQNGTIQPQAALALLQQMGYSPQQAQQMVAGQ